MKPYLILKSGACALGLLLAAQAEANPSLVGEWLNGPASLADVSGYSPTGTHDGYIVGNGNYVFTNDVPAGKSGRSLWFWNGDTGMAISNSSTLDAGYTNTFDGPTQTNFTVTLWARGFPGDWNAWVSKYGESETGWQLRDDGSVNNGQTWACFTVRNGSQGTVGLGTAVYNNPDDLATRSIASNDGHWHFYAGVFSSVTGVRSLYIDGVLAAQETGNIAYDLAAAEHLCIGAKDNPPGNNFGNFSTFEIYDVRTYNYDLTASNVLQAAGDIPPVFGTQPQSVVAYAGTNAQLTATVGGTTPLVYQWQRDGTNLSNSASFSGVNSNTLTILNAEPAEDGTYQLIVTNAIGRTVSSAATVIIEAQSLVGEWLSGPASLADASGYSPRGTHDAYVVGNGNYAFTNDVPLGWPGQSLYFFNGDTGLAISNSSTLDAGYTNTYDDLINNAFTVTCWAKGFPGTWNPWVSKFGEAEAGWQLRDDGSDNGGETYSCFTVRNGNAGTVTLGSDPYGDPDDLATRSIASDDGNWHFYAGVFNSVTGVRSLYVDGVLAAQETGNTTYDLAAAEHLCIGAKDSPPGNLFGSFSVFEIYDVLVFNYDLSSNAVVDLYYSGGTGGAPAPFVPVAVPSTNVYVGNPVVLSDFSLGIPPFQYQWESNGVALAGATNSSLLLGSLTLASSPFYSVIVSNSAGAATSAPVVLNIQANTIPPAVQTIYNLGTSNVVLVFASVISAATATNPANYALSGGLAVTAASLAADNLTVTLTTAPLTYYSNYSIVINGVANRGIPPVIIGTNTLVSFTASPYIPVDIGNPAIASTTQVSSNGVEVVAAGGGIGGTADQFNYQYESVSGDFDISVRLASLNLSSLWAQAGLLARASLIPGSPFAAALATPGLNGDSFDYRLTTNGTAAGTGSFPVNYPNTWLRLSRAGNVFTGFGSYDGTNWTQLGTATIAMPGQIYVGLAVASYNVSQPTTAQFLDYENTPANAVVAATVNPHEPMGPSSRNTGIVISEIMWKPAPRTDGNNPEFLELYNTLPYFQDISGYTVTCADMNYTFPTNTIIPGGACFVLAASPQSMANVYGLTANVFGPYTGSLKHSETLELLDEQSNVLLTVPYTDVYPWPVATGGTGHSLVLANPTYGEGDPRAWDISDQVGGSPGQLDPFTPSPLRNVVINEILPHTENPAVPQFIELYNHSTNSVDVSGCILTDDPATNKFVLPAGTVIGPAGFRAFTQSQFGFTLNGQGETLYFIKPDGSRVLDAVQFGAQPDGVSYGRWPDGANDFYNFTTNTPGTNNSPILIGNIVINELMYDPISGNNDDQYIELYNQGTNTINLGGWQLTSGVTFTFPPNALIASKGYVVVAKNTAELFSNYPNLNAANTYGNFSSHLSHDGALVVLAQPESFFGTNTIYVEEDQVAYGAGGRWGEWSAGGGSSLELIDPHSNHRLAANWADSDETQTSSWMLVSNTGVLDNGANYDPTIDYAQIGVLDVGESLVDNITVEDNGSNYVSNGTFDGGLGLTNWVLQGTLSSSSLENTGYQSSGSLHLRCSDKIWTGDNSCEVALNPNSMAAGDTVTLSYRARWLRGWPGVLFRLNGNWLEATATLPVPANLGTPGTPNSQYITNAGPAIYNVTHNPPVPAANQPVVVTANVGDPDGLQNFTLYYRLDPAANYTAVPMLDNGTGGDAVPGDGVYSATIPGQAANQIVAFYLAATDRLGAATRFPALLNDNTTPRECVVMFGDGNPGGSFAVAHVWLTQTNATRWANLGNLSRDWKNDVTFVDGTRVIYNAGGRFSGSPYHQIFTTPDGAQACSYEFKFKDDDKYLGVTDYKKLHPPGGDPGSDLSLQESQTAFTFVRSLGEPWLYKRYVALYVNGSRRNGTLMEDTQVPNSDVVKEHFPNDDDGYLFKMQPWFEFSPTLSGGSMGFENQSWCCLMPYLTTGGVKKAARYRWNYEIRRTPDTYSDFTNVLSLVDAANSYGTPNYVGNLENLANMENWMRVFAALHAAGCWDSFGSDNAQNLYGYIGAQGTKYTLLMWELETVFGNNGGWAPGVGLLSVNGQDPNMQNIYNTPAFLRMYWRGMQELINGPLNLANTTPLLTAKYNAFIANGLNVQSPAVTIEPWISQARTSIAAQLAAVNATSFAVNPTVTLSNNLAYVTGTAPVNVATIGINGAAYPLTWTSLTGWTVVLPLTTGTNNLNVVGLNRSGQAIAGDSNLVSVVYSSTNASPVGQVVINEIMYAPAIPNAQFVELYNNSTNTAFDLSGWQLQGLDYTFPDGATLAPTNYLVLAANGSAFAAAYGATNPVFDIFSGTLPPAGGRLILNTATNATVTQVEYENQLPWPTNANGSGASLQLVDPRQDNWREGNWLAVAGVATPDGSNSVAASLAPFPPLWINEVQPVNLTGITNSAGQHTPWVELYNASAHAVSLNGLYLAGTYTNLLQWAFPTNASISAGQFKVVFADGQTNLSTTNELHAGFTLPGSSGSVALSRMGNTGQPQVIDYLDYQNIGANDTYGSYPDGQSFVRQEFFLATPGASNNGTASPPPSFVYYAQAGSTYTQNFDALPDPGATSVNTANPVTINGITYSLANPFDFAGPVLASGGGGLGVSAMAGWYGSSESLARFGATDGDQTTGGQISFGPANGSNRALGMLATSSTGGTAFGVRLVNGTGQTLNFMNLQYLGEVWRQSNLPKTLQFYYFLDPTGTAGFPNGPTAYIPALNVNFPINGADSGGAAVVGTSSVNQTNLVVTNQPIASWLPGAALWLMWQMTDPTGKAQGLAVDNLSFSASVLPVGFVAPAVTSTLSLGTNLNLTCPTLTGLSYQLEFNSNLTGTNWLPVGAPVAGTGNPATFSTSLTNSQQFFRVQILP